MKVLLHCPVPFALAHGGHQIQIEQTFKALRKIGVQVEHLRWWDDSQAADLIHFFGRAPIEYIEMAHRKGIKVVMAELLTGAGSRTGASLWAQRTAIRVSRRLPVLLTRRYGWESFREADACVALTGWEGHLMEYVFGTPHDRVHVIPNGVEDVFLATAPGERGRYLVCSATITERKRVLELAEAAVAASTPLWIIGKPYAPDDPYARRFLEFAKAHSDLVRYEGPLQDRTSLAAAYRNARGFVLLSTMESLSLSALEAAACGCPLLLSQLPWATTVFGQRACYCPANSSLAHTAGVLKAFYDSATGMPAPQKPLSWLEVGEQLRALYGAVLGM